MAEKSFFPIGKFWRGKIGFIFFCLLAVGTVWILRSHTQTKMQKNEGQIFGTSYHFKYKYRENLEQVLINELKDVDNALSSFNKNSIISKVNRNEAVALNEKFTTVFNLAQEVSKETDGAFDITVWPLVNIWGFGTKQRTAVDSAQIDSLLPYIGYKKIAIEGGKVVKKDARTQLDFSAIAKGYGVDCVARVLDKYGVKDYMLEIGGEVVVKGKNAEGKAWGIGLQKPKSGAQGETFQTVIHLDKGALATSGNYYNFYEKDGKKYAHTIDPKTGRPVVHSLLSATVYAPSCAEADAYATAFMVMGTEKAIMLLKKHPRLQAFLIYDDNGTLNTWHTANFPQ